MHGARLMPQLNFRIPPDIKAWLEEKAKADRMSVTAWLVRMIEKEKKATNAN